MDELNKQHYMRRQSLAFNMRNRFVSSSCEYEIAGINFYKSTEEIDSLPKIKLIDTSLAYLDNARLSLKASLRNVDTDFLLQKNKNKRKQMMLLTENRSHLDFIKGNISATHAQKRNTKSLANKSKVNTDIFRRRKTKIRG